MDTKKYHKNNHSRGVFPENAKNVPELRIAAKSWARRNADISPEDFEQVVSSLIREPSSMKKCMGGILLDYLPKQRKLLDPFLYELWLDDAAGWGEIDAICYGHATAEEMLGNFKIWKLLIVRLAQSEHINKRRGSIVLLTKAVKQSHDERLVALSFSIIGMLQHEKSILITKAISWLLRNMIKTYGKEVEAYLNRNEKFLPKIAIRETRNKLRSGRKSGK